MCGAWYVTAGAFSAKSPWDLGPPANIEISAFSGNVCTHCASLIPLLAEVPECSAPEGRQLQ